MFCRVVPCAMVSQHDNAAQQQHSMLHHSTEQQGLVLQSMLCPVGLTAFVNPKTSISIQKRHPYIENLNRETLGDSKTCFYIVEMI